jgi:hypothetical protein
MYRELTFANVCGEHSAGLQRLGEHDRHRSKTGPDIGNGHSWPETENFRELGRIKLCLFSFLGHLLGVWFLACSNGN